MMNTDDDDNCRMHVNSRLTALLTRSDGVNVILINLVVVGTDVTLQLKHRNEKQVAGRFLLDALARAHFGRTMALQRIADEINDKL
ncbi:unnamed protein product [Sphagnum jensenii]|uniref:Uncharacterized protein n=1 Tax=Sphagnum jensenii TaxID=128206 RepID=A0ABP0XKI7_9BRYO